MNSIFFKDKYKIFDKIYESTKLHISLFIKNQNIVLSFLSLKTYVKFHKTYSIRN